MLSSLSHPELFEQSVTLLNRSAFLYLLAASLFISSLLFSKKLWVRTCVWSANSLTVIAFIIHTGALLMRWYMGGIDRPPWTNLYESLIFFAWGPALFQVIAQFKWRFPYLGAISMPLVFLLMGMAAMTPNKEVEPLLPSLQSHWLKIHVMFGMIAYAGFTISACFSFFHLMKNSVPMRKILGIVSLIFAFCIALSGGKDAFKTGRFYMTQTVLKTLPNGSQKRVKDIYRDYEGGPVKTRVKEVPKTQGVFWGALAGFALTGLFLLFSGGLKKVAGGMFLLSTASFMTFFYRVNQAVKSMEELSWQSNPYLMLLLFTVLIILILVLLISLRPKVVLEKLPSAQRLEELSYKNILFAFPFQSLLLITGAIWAYYAWGRSWGWDPKETWALITWFAYLIYLHGKLLLGWKHNTLSIISIVGFVIMVFAFLGVNLVLSGLHSYGSA